MNLKNKRSLVFLVLISFFLIKSGLIAQKKGTDLADSLLIELNKATVDTSKVSLNNGIAQAILGINPDLARKYATDALTLAKNINWKMGIANSLTRIGNSYWMTSKPTEAYDYYFKALTLYKEIDYKYGIATATGNIGLTYADMRKDSLAIKYYEDALAIDKSINNLKGVIRHQLNLGVIYSEKGNYKKSLNYYFESLKYTNQATDKINEGIVLGNIGNIYNKLKKYDKAIEYYFKAIEINKINKYDVSLVYNYYNLAGIYSDLDSIDKSQYYYEQILGLQDKIGDQSMIISVKSSLANILAEKKQHIEAIKLYKDNEGEIQKVESKSEKSLYYLGYGSVYLSKVIQDSIKNKNNIGKEIDFAIKYFELARKFMDTTNFNPINAQIFESLYKSYVLKKNYFKAFEYLSTFKVFKDSIFSKDNRTALVEFESKLELELKRKQLKIKELEIEKAKANQLFTVIALGLAVALLLTFIYLFSANLKKTKLLQEQNIKINDVNQTKDKLFAIIAHDLINPVSNFKNVTQVLHDSFKELDEADQLEYLSLMKQSSEGLLDMLKNLLEWSRIQRGQIQVNKEYFPIINLVNQNLSLFKVSAMNKNINIQSEVTNEKLKVNADYNLFSTTVRNLISNAIKFTPEGGDIIISSDLIEKNNLKYVELKIKDSGVGISKLNIEKLFKLANIKSTPGTQNEKGTGLGLLLCKDFMDMQNGEIRIESEMGQGTTVILTIQASNE